MRFSLPTKNPEGTPALTCRLCDATTHQDVWWDDALGHFFGHCQHCAYRYKCPDALPDAHREKAHYDLHQNSFRSHGYVRMNQRIVDRAIVPYASPPGHALDFGCGPGPVLASMLHRTGWRIALYDPFYAPYFHWQRYRYRLIVTIEVLEHLFYPAAILPVLADRLEAGGIWAISTLSYPWDQVAFAQWWYRREPTHTGFFRRETLLHLASTFGFRLLFHDDKQLTVLQKPE